MRGKKKIVHSVGSTGLGKPAMLTYVRVLLLTVLNLKANKREIAQFVHELSRWPIIMKR